MLVERQLLGIGCPGVKQKAFGMFGPHRQRQCVFGCGSHAAQEPACRVVGNAGGEMQAQRFEREMKGVKRAG